MRARLVSVLGPTRGSRTAADPEARFWTVTDTIADAWRARGNACAGVVVCRRRRRSWSESLRRARHAGQGFTL